MNKRVSHLALPRLLATENFQTATPPLPDHRNEDTLPTQGRRVRLLILANLANFVATRGLALRQRHRPRPLHFRRYDDAAPRIMQMFARLRGDSPESSGVVTVLKVSISKMR